MEATGESSLPDNTGGAGVLHRIARWSAMLFGVALAFLVAQEYHGIGLTETFRVGPNSYIVADGKAWVWHLPGRYRGELMNTRGDLLENGVPLLNRAKSNEIVREKGAGWFRFFHGRLRFSTPDDTDPRTNGRTYEVRLPRQFRRWHFWLVGILLTVSLLTFHMTRPAADEVPRGRERSVVWQTLAVFVTALVLLLLRHGLSPPYTDGAVCLKDVPLSDASGWHQMARGMVEGRGLDADFQENRPLHPVLMAPIYALFGSSLSAVRIVNCIMLALTASGAWLFGLILRSRAVAIGAAVVLGILPDHAALTHMVMTENSGMILAVLSALALLLSTWHLSPKWSYAAGLINGFASLSCGFTLLTLPFYAFVALLNPLLRRAPWQRSVIMAVVFTLGVSTILLPWMIRQKVVNHRFTLTFATPDLLFGGANVDEGGFGSQAFRDAAEKGHELNTPLKRYDYFMTEYKRIVADSPATYFKKVAKSSLHSFSLVRLMEPEFVTVGLLLLLSLAVIGVLSGSAPPRLLAVGLLMWAWLQIPPDALLPVFLASWFLTFRRARWPEERLALIILGLTVIGVAMLDGLGGNTAPRRFWLTGDWAMALIILLALVRATEATESILNTLFCRLPFLKKLGSSPRRDGMGRQFENVAPVIKWGIGCTIGYTALAITLVLTWAALGQRNPWPGLDSVDTQAAITRALAQYPRAELRKGSPHVRSFIARLDDLIIPMRAGEDLGHWLPGFSRREVAHTVVSVSCLGPNGERTKDVEVIITGSLDQVPRGQPLLWLVVDHPEANGISGVQEPVSEALGIVPLKQQPNGNWAPDPPVWFEIASEAVNALGI